MNIARNWNLIDSALYFIEEKCHDISAAIQDEREEDPDVEEIIAAEMKYLRAENEKLKKRDYPHKVEIDRTSGEQRSGITCPCCGISITAYLRLDKSDEAYYPKYCFECGNRLWFSRMKY